MSKIYTKSKQAEEREEQSLKLTLRQPWVWSVSDFFIFSALVGGQSSPSPSHFPTDSVRSV